MKVEVIFKGKRRKRILRHRGRVGVFKLRSYCSLGLNQQPRPNFEPIPNHVRAHRHRRGRSEGGGMSGSNDDLALNLGGENNLFRYSDAILARQA